MSAGTGDDDGAAADATTSVPPASEQIPPASNAVPPDDLPADHPTARIAVYEVLEHLQAVPDHDGNRDRLERWAAQARAAGWPDVTVQVMHALLVNDLFGGVPHDRLRRRADDFRAAADETGDDIFVARALGGRVTYLGVADDDPLDDLGGDIARAVAMLSDLFEGGRDTLGPRAIELAASYNECAQAYHWFELWELEEEMYDRAVASFDLVLPDDPLLPILGFARRVFVVNRFESAAAAACAFLGAGRTDEARALARTCYRPTPAELATLPAAWAVSLRAVARLLDAVAADREDEAAPLRDVPADLWDALEDAAWDGYRGFVLLAAAVAAHDAGDAAGAAAHAERALPYFDVYRPSFRNLAHRIVALGSPGAVGPDGADSAALRWALHLTGLRHESRLQLLAASRARLASERVVRSGEQLRRQALVDELTGVANRHAFNEHLDRLRQGAPERRLGVVLLDLDAFKAVNDVHGHLVGDEVLRAVGRVLAGAVRGTDLAVRLGGDEFALLLEVTGRSGLGRRVATLVDRIRRQDWGRLATGLRVTISAGSAAGPARDVDELLRVADENLYRAKATGRDRLVG